MEVAGYLLYAASVLASLVLTKLTRRDLVSLTGAILVVVYASLSAVDLAVISALTIMLFSLSRIALARPLRDRRVALMKIKYVLAALAILSSSIPVTYVALGVSLSLMPLENQPLAVVVAALLYALLAASVSPSVDFLVNPKLWRKLEVGVLESFFWKLGVVLGGVAMLANVAAHGVVGFILMTIYLASFLLSTKLRPLLSKPLLSLVAGASAVVTYLVGYA
ncbi:MAG: hypothetical protein RMH84_03275 [Sulfolobales archaeon]|nr:hypothetical protein [Sulfolobales archaeon]MCX8209310.1 hypothetical protein [Sulfolobales archaeon]MDW8010599.1 hypothetical protein [Sulfolobales archaeon]